MIHAGRPAGARSDQADWLFSACLTVAAFLPRLYVSLTLPREPVWDGHYYELGARRIAEGLGYSDGTMGFQPWSHWPVGYSGFLAGVYELFGTGPRVATVAGAVVSALIVLAVHRLARHWLSAGRARVAAVLCALHPGLIAYSALVMSEPLAALLLLVAGLFAIRDRKRHFFHGTLAAGVVLGLGTLVRPTFIFHAPALALLHLDLRHLRKSLGRAALAGGIGTLVALAIVTPWTLRNCQVLDGCAFVSTNGGWNLAIGTLPRATGRFEPLLPSDGCQVPEPVAQDACFRDMAIASIRSDPVRWLALVPKKLGHAFNHESYPIEYLREADPDRWEEPKRFAGRVILSAIHRILLTAAAFGVVALAGFRRRGIPQLFALALVTGLAALAWHRVDGAFWPLALAIVVIGVLPLPGAPAKGPVWRWIAYSLGSVLVTHAIFFGEDRYHIVVTPMLCILAAAALRRPDVTLPPSTSDIENRSVLPPASKRAA